MPSLIKKLKKKGSSFIDEVKSSTSRSPKEDPSITTPASGADAIEEPRASVVGHQGEAASVPTPAPGGDAAVESESNLSEPVAEPVPDPTLAPGADAAAESEVNLTGQAAQSVSVPTPAPEADATVDSTAGLTGHDAEQATPVDQVVTSAEESHGTSLRTPVTCWDRAFQRLQETNKQVYDDLQTIADYKQVMLLLPFKLRYMQQRQMLVPMFRVKELSAGPRSIYIAVMC